MTEINAGTKIIDCDPRRTAREGEVIAATQTHAWVRWASGKNTVIELADVHQRADAKDGYRAVAKLAAVS